MTGKSDWRAILSAFAVGVAGAVQVGRVAPVAPFIQQELALDLVAMGWLVSLVTLGAALFGLFAGYWAVRNGLRASLLTGALLMVVCAIVAALAPSVPVLMGARVVEGLGYLLVVVAAPTLMAREASARDTPVALALWGTFFTLGLSLAAFAGGIASEIIGWRGWFLGSAGLLLLAALAATVSTPRGDRQTGGAEGLGKTIADMPGASWLLGAAFFGVTLLTLALISLLPAFLVQQHGFSPGAAGGVTGGVALSSMGGSLCYGLLANRLSETTLAFAASLALIACGFPAFAAAATAGQTIAFAGAAIFVSGALVAQTFANVPKVAGAPRLVGPGNGLVAQLGSIGALAGPPLVAVVVSMAGWDAVPLVIAGFTLSFVLLFTLALRSHRAVLLKDTP